MLTNFAQLGSYIQSNPAELQSKIQETHLMNPWFTIDNIQFALDAIAKEFLDHSKLEYFVSRYTLQESVKRVGLVMAGNIPLVGFHDLLCTLLSGNKALIKLSAKDSILIPFLIEKLTEIDPTIKDKVEILNQLKNFDAVIATGSNNSARYFEYYFGKYPHIIRKNRVSVGVLTGSESKKQLQQFGEDIFRYFGLGCRNVAKLYVPKGYDFKELFEALETYNWVTQFDKYMNNFDYQTALLLLNQTQHLQNGFLLLKEDIRLHSPISMLFYQEYNDERDVKQQLNMHASAIQCVVSSNQTIANALPLGESQKPSLADFADDIDTMNFLTKLE